MAASEATCEICSLLSPKKQRRTIGAETIHPQKQQVEVIEYEPPKDSSHYVCMKCFNRLNKLAKIDFDLLHKLDQLTVERRGILQELRSLLKPYQKLFR